jgi:hypothetical protein
MQYRYTENAQFFKRGSVERAGLTTILAAQAHFFWRKPDTRRLVTAIKNMETPRISSRFVTL